MSRPGFRVQDFAHLGDRIRQAMAEIYTALRGGLTLHDNVNMLTVSHTFGGVADTSEDVDISGLGITWIPAYFLTIETNDGAVVYPNDTSHTGWTSSKVVAKSTKADTVAVLAVF